jgi:hypothetical protein
MVSSLLQGSSDGLVIDAQLPTDLASVETLLFESEDLPRLGFGREAVCFFVDLVSSVEDAIERVMRVIGADR